ncbi:MAG: molybdopterin molybdenumtransferase MoeA [Gammaproteobacteria bacterium]|nr:MAG: molybdopterin molybdenumtransferase MoeA [Gammaproteobacteria bacterium]
MNHGCDEFDPNQLTVEQALERILETVAPVSGRERLHLRQALDRVLLEPVVATFDVPPHRNSAMDGYALRAADLGTDGTRLRVVGRSMAGAPFEGRVGAGEAVRIMTGAVVPEGADTVVMQEQTEREGDEVVIRGNHREGANIRHPGEDMRAGSTVLEAGRQLNAADVGLLASLGIAEVTVYRRPRVAFFSTGDELRGIGEPLGEGDIYDSNRYTLDALLARLPVERLDMGVIPDDLEAVRKAFREAAAVADLVLTTGGVSVGEADYIKTVLEELGQIGFWRIAMKPGKPLAFGNLGQAHFFGLPGNPVSTMATFVLFVRPALQRMMGRSPEAPLRLRARVLNDLRKSPGRKDHQRGILRQEGGELVVETTGLQGSHVLSSMSRANCFIVLPRGSGPVASGEEVEVLPFFGLL